MSKYFVTVLMLLLVASAALADSSSASASASSDVSDQDMDRSDVGESDAFDSTDEYARHLPVQSDDSGDDDEDEGDVYSADEEVQDALFQDPDVYDMDDNSDYWGRRRRRGWFRRVTRVARRVVRRVVRVVRKVARPVRRIVRRVVRVVRRVARPIARAVRRVVRRVGRVVKKAVRSVGRFVSKAVRTVKRVARKFGKFVKKAVKKVGGFVAKIGAKVAGFLNKVAPWAVKIMQSKWFKIGSMILSFVPGIGTALGGISGMFSSLGGLGSNLITRGLAMASKMGGSLIGKLAAGVTKGFNVLSGGLKVTRLGGMLGKVANFATKAINVTRDLAQGKIFSVFKSTLGQTPFAQKLLSGSVGKLIAKGQALFGKIPGPIQGILKGKFEELKNKLVDKVKARLMKFKPFRKVANTFGSIFDKVTRVLGTERLSLKGILSTLKDKNKLAGVIKGQLGKMFMRTKLGKTFLKYRDVFESTVGQIKGFKYSWQKVVGAPKTLLTSVKSKFGSFARDLVAFKGLKGKLSTVVSRYVKGPILGVLGKFGKKSLLHTVMNTANRVVAYGKRLFGGKFASVGGKLLAGVQNMLKNPSGALGAVKSILSQGKGVVSSVKRLFSGGLTGKSFLGKVSTLFKRGKEVWTNVKNLVGSVRETIGQVTDIVNVVRGKTGREEDMFNPEQEAQMEEAARVRAQEDAETAAVIKSTMDRVKQIMADMRTLFEGKAVMETLQQAYGENGSFDKALLKESFDGSYEFFLAHLDEMRDLLNIPEMKRVMTEAQVKTLVDNTQKRGETFFKQLAKLFEDAEARHAFETAQKNKLLNAVNSKEYQEAEAIQQEVYGLFSRARVDELVKMIQTADESEAGELEKMVSGAESKFRELIGRLGKLLKGSKLRKLFKPEALDAQLAKVTKMGEGTLQRLRDMIDARKKAAEGVRVPELEKKNGAVDKKKLAEEWTKAKFVLGKLRPDNNLAEVKGVVVQTRVQVVGLVKELTEAYAAHEKGGKVDEKTVRRLMERAQVMEVYESGLQALQAQMEARVKRTTPLCKCSWKKNGKKGQRKHCKCLADQGERVKHCSTKTLKNKKKQKVCQQCFCSRNLKIEDSFCRKGRTQCNKVSRKATTLNQLCVCPTARAKSVKKAKVARRR